MGEGSKRDRIEEMYPAPCFPHGLKEISMEFLYQHLLCTLWGGGEGVKKKRTFCTLVKMSIIMDDPLSNYVLAAILNFEYHWKIHFSFLYKYE